MGSQVWKCREEGKCHEVFQPQPILKDLGDKKERLPWGSSDSTFL